MMKYHIVLSGSIENIMNQAKELYYFSDNYLKDIPMGKTIIFYETNIDEDELKKIVRSQEAVMIELQFYHAESILNHDLSWVEDDDLYLFGSGFQGSEQCVRIAERRKGTSLLSVHRLKRNEMGILAKKMVYSSFMEGEFHMKRGPFCVGVAKGMGEADLNVNENQVTIQFEKSKNHPDYILSYEIKKEEVIKSLSDAELLFIAGRGMKSKEQVMKLNELAKSFQGEMGVSRPVAMNAWAPMSQLVGVSGTMTKPKLCVVFGASGAPALFAGIEKSKKIIAINNDTSASIQKKADEVIQCNCEEIIEELQMRLNKL